MTVKVKVKEYIDDLIEEEAKKPLYQRKPVPSPNDMAKAAGVARQTMHSFLHRDEHKRVDLVLLDSVISQLRGYGHNTKLTDVLEYVEG